MNLIKLLNYYRSNLSSFVVDSLFQTIAASHWSALPSNEKLYVFEEMKANEKEDEDIEMVLELISFALHLYLGFHQC